MKARASYLSRSLNPLTSGAAIALLLLYVAGTVELDSFHSFVHSPNTEAKYDPTVEMDPCHRTLVHGDKATGCHHKFHLAKSNTCQLCQIAHHTDHVVSRRLSWSAPLVTFVSPGALPAFTFKTSIDGCASRAPPVS